MTSALQATLAAYMANHADPTAGGALYDALAPDARVPFGGAIRRVGDLPRAQFARYHGLVAKAWGDAHLEVARPPVVADLVVSGHREEGPDRVVAWATAREAEADRALTLAAGLVRSGAEGPWLVDWAILADREADWTFASGRARALAEYPFANTPIPPRSWLDVSYHRMFGLPMPALLTLADARFSCQGSGACCRMDFDVELPPSAQAFIDAVPWDEVAPHVVGHTQLETLPSGNLHLKGEREACRFLDEKNHCMVHKAIGRSVFEPCTIFPYQFARTPEGVAVATSALCGSVRGRVGAPLPANARDIWTRLAIGTVWTTKAYRLVDGVAVPWEAFRDAEKLVIDTLARRDLPLHRRLWVITRLLPALATDAPIDWATWSTEPIPAHDAEDQDAFRSLLGRLPAWIFQDLGDGGPIPAVAHAALRDEELLVDTMINAVHGKRLSYPFDLMTAHNLLVLLYVMALTMQAYYPDRPIPERVRQLPGLLLSHNALFQTLATGEFAELAGIARLLRLPAYGQWLLGYPSQTQQ